MGKTSAKWKQLSRYFRAFLFVALAFLVVGVGTLGTAQSAGKGYELQYQTSDDAKTPCLIFHITPPKDKEGNNITVRLTQVYLNLGAIYSKEGAVTLTMNRSSSATSSSFTSSKSATLADATRCELAEGQKDADLFNWIAPFDASAWSNVNVTSYPYYKLAVSTNSSSTTKKANVLINEVVFVGEGYEDGELNGKRYLLPAEIDSHSTLPYDAAKGEDIEDAVKKASAVLDSPKIPSTAQSSFFRFGKEEQSVMSALAEMHMGTTYVEGDVYYGETAYNALGLDLCALGTLIFGMSPFGLRFFPMLAAFGLLLVGYFFVRRLFRSDKAAFVFAVLFALCGASFSLAHLGTPLMIGLFFLLASLSACHKFYAEGMEKGSASSALPLLASGISGALAICVNGAFVLPVLGVVALFVAGMVRQQKARRYYLDKAIAEAETAGEEDVAAKENVATVVNEYRYKNTVAPVVFGVSLLFGAFFLSLLFMLPASFAYVKLFYSPSSAVSIFTLGRKAFAAGFAGSSSAVWSPVFRTFVGSGERFAVTASVVNPVALIAALFGIAFALYRIVRLLCRAGKDFGKEERAEMRSLVIPLVGLVLSLITASFAGGALAFVFAAYLFAFALAAGGVKTLDKTLGEKKTKIILIVALALLAVCFVLFAVFTFSVPLPASFVGKFVG